jgi:hypothetical protein
LYGFLCHRSSGVEHAHGKGGVGGSNPPDGSIYSGFPRYRDFYSLIPFMMEQESLKYLAEKYMQYCEVMRNYRPYTIEGHKNTFKIFFMMTDVEYPQELNVRVFEEFFFKGRADRKWSAVTFKAYLKSLDT